MFLVAPRKRWDRALEWLMELENSIKPKNRE
jgi:hypothetical protein